MRIRSIKPEFWRSDDVNALRIEDRLLFIGLWSYVDDNGVGIDRFSNICADLFAHDLSVSPHDTLMRVQEGLKRLQSLGVIVRYSVGSKDYLEIVNWSKHQKINRPSPGRYPRSEAAETVNHDSLTESSLKDHESSRPGAGEQGNRGTGEQITPIVPLAGDGKRNEYPDEFKLFWSAYPKNADKRTAFKAWEKAIKRADPDTVLAGAERYRDDPNRSDAYTKNAATWLNADAWENEALPQRFDQSRDQRANDTAMAVFGAATGEQWALGV